MKIRGDIERINLSTGERFQRVSGEGESYFEAIREGYKRKEKEMSWSTFFVKPVPKREAAAAISALTIGGQAEGPAMDQCELAKHVAHSLLPIIPGPYIQVILSGHANGVGWQKKEGWANDCITVNITQMTEADISK